MNDVACVIDISDHKENLKSPGKNCSTVPKTFAGIENIEEAQSLDLYDNHCVCETEACKSMSNTVTDGSDAVSTLQSSSIKLSTNEETTDSILINGNNDASLDIIKPTDGLEKHIHGMSLNMKDTIDNNKNSIKQINEEPSTNMGVGNTDHLKSSSLNHPSLSEEIQSEILQQNCLAQDVLYNTSSNNLNSLDDQLADLQSSTHKCNDSSKEKSLGVTADVQNLMEQNLEKFSPKKEPKQTNNLPHDKNKIDSFILSRPHRINPFNHVESAESSDVWEKRIPVGNSQVTTSNSSSIQSLSSYEQQINSPVNNSFSEQNFNSHKFIGNQSMSSDFYENAHPHFDLMPSMQIYPASTPSNIEEDVDAIVQEAKRSNCPEPAADPWVKMDQSGDTSHSNSCGDGFSAQSSDHNANLEQPPHESHINAIKSCENLVKSKPQQSFLPRPLIEAAGPCEPEDLIEGIIFTAYYLGSTQLQSEKNPGKNARMMQAQEAVSRIKAPEGESQPSVEVDLFISTDKVKILNANNQETIMDHTLRSISYIADIGKLLVIMAKRRAPQTGNPEDQQVLRDPKPQRSYKIICHVFSSHDSHLMAQAIGQAFTVAYQQFLSANGIEPQTLTRDDYNQLLDMQEMYHDDLVHYSKRENLKDIWVEKNKGELLGVVIVESGWGSIVPTVILANLQHGGPAERCGKLNIGDQIMTINGTSLVGLPLTTCQSIVKGLRSQTIAHLKIVSCPPVVTVLIKRPDLKYQLGFSVQEGIICSLMRGGIAERGGVRVGHRIIEINGQSVVATSHEKIVQTLVSSVGEIQMKTMPAMMYRLLTGQEQPIYI